VAFLNNDLILELSSLRELIDYMEGMVEGYTRQVVMQQTTGILMIFAEVPLSMSVQA
jgi:hypothetical protein